MPRKYLLLILIGLTTLVADQVTKYLAVSHLTSALAGRSGLDRVVAFVTEQNLDNNPIEPGNPIAYRVKGEVRFIEDYWHFRYAENPGAAWGLFATLPDGVRGPFFIGVSLIALAFIGNLFRQLLPSQRFLQIALALVSGGALGNFVDRVLRGYVIDFIDWHWRNQPGMRWPTFNVADVAITIGVAMMILSPWFEPKAAAAPTPAPLPENEPSGV